MSTIKILGKNIRFLVLNRFVGMVLLFILFPFIVTHVGKENYGVYLIVTTFTGYFGLLDFGVMSALTKFVSEYHGADDKKSIYRIINASFTFYVIIGIAIAGLLFTCFPYFFIFFKINPTTIPVAKQLFTIAAISALFVWPLSTFRGIIQGLNLWNLDATVNMIAQLLNAITTFVLLSLGHGIVSIFIAMQISLILANIVYLYLAKKNISFKLVFPFLEFKTFKFIFNFSFFMFLSSLLSLFIYQIHNLIIGYFISVSAITLYAVAYNFQNYFRIINSTIGASPWISASGMEGRRDYDRQQELVFKGTKYMTAAILPLIIVTFFFTEPFICYWIGPGFKDSVMPTKIIILFWLFNSTLESASGMLSAKGIVKAPLFIQLAVALLNIILGISLIKVLGITAMAVGLTISAVFVGFPLTLWLSLKTLNIPLKDYFNKAIKSNIYIYLFAGLLSFLALKTFYPPNLSWTLFEMALIYSILIGSYYFVVLDKSEKTQIIKLIGIGA